MQRLEPCPPDSRVDGGSGASLFFFKGLPFLRSRGRRRHSGYMSRIASAIAMLLPTADRERHSDSSRIPRWSLSST